LTTVTLTKASDLKEKGAELAMESIRIESIGNCSLSEAWATCSKMGLDSPSLSQTKGRSPFCWPWPAEPAKPCWLVGVCEIEPEALLAPGLFLISALISRMSLTLSRDVQLLLINHEKFNAACQCVTINVVVFLRLFYKTF
jgi:hypothetical protein